MTALQIAAILQLLLSFGVSQTTVNNVDAILTNAATPTAIVTTAPVGNTGPLPTTTQTQTAPTASTPAATTPQTTTTNTTSVVSIPQTPASVATTPAPAPAITLTNGTNGVAFITAGADPIEVENIAVSVTGTVTDAIPITVSIGGKRLMNEFDSDFLPTIKAWPTATWYVYPPTNQIPAGGTIEIDINAPGATSAKVTAYTATDMKTGDDISQHITVNGYRF